MNKKLIIQTVWCTAWLLLVSVGKTVAQTDPHFTQHYTFPMYLNPALAGSADGDYRVSGIFRNQWGSITNPYRTMGLSFDARTNKNVGLGVNLLNQSAGDGGFNYLTTSASFAYTGIKFGPALRHHVVLAMQGGIINRRVNKSKFKWGEQWDPITGYSANNPTTETFSHTSSTVLDIGAGAMYFDAAADKKFNPFGGFSIYHLNKPKDPIISTQSTELNTIPMRYSIHGGVSYNLSDRTRIVPHILYMRQGTASEAMVGVYGQINVDADTDFMLGGYYRGKDAVAPYVGIDYKNFVIGLSYDVNNSKLGSMTKNVNSFELSLSYVKRSGTRSVVDFIRCARL
ncbi:MULTISPECIES: PorP/SprF family type IX secretion system membrane protein [Niastella]|uniref:PorP/SprF family type IX secretion system membrane protein n=1 Tax=Niastella soli TaxID=2821487 RepID=A0ABS3YWN9_9BACT|nr:PorP/SprF family type IX secretion system membrane protein [Niastella soli]MBO9202349.1 PorP/SprF family type IX secretion system membrane protein [Niastella soli]